MSLSAAGPRRLVHRRDIQLCGYVREDGQMEVEARMCDVKTYSMPSHDRHLIAAGEPLHDMWIRLTLLPDTMEITGCEASMDATPYGICPQTAPHMGRLVGLKIGKGFLRAAAQRVGGVEGCTHLRELLQPLATVAYQTRYSLQVHPHALEGKMQRGERDSGPGLLNSCHSYAETSPVVARLRQAEGWGQEETR